MGFRLSLREENGKHPGVSPNKAQSQVHCEILWKASLWDLLQMFILYPLMLMDGGTCYDSALYCVVLVWQKSRKSYIDLLLLWVINLVDIFIWACIKMPGEHAVDFSCSLILIICCPHCVRSYLKITYKSITALLILKLPDASCILKVRLYFYC